MELFWRDGGKCRASSEKCVQSTAVTSGDWLAKGECFDDGTAERLAIGTRDDDIGGGDFGQGGFVHRVEGQNIVQSKLGSCLF